MIIAMMMVQAYRDLKPSNPLKGLGFRDLKPYNTFKGLGFRVQGP